MHETHFNNISRLNVKWGFRENLFPTHVFYEFEINTNIICRKYCGCGAGAGQNDESLDDNTLPGVGVDRK